MADAQRGQLGYEVFTSTPQPEADKEFSISVKATNPFDVPVTINSVATKPPTEFVDVTRRRIAARQRMLEDRLMKLIKSRLPDATIAKERKNVLAKQLTKNVLRMMPFGDLLGTSVATGVTVADYMRATNATAMTAINQVADSVTPHDIQVVLEKAKGSPDPETQIRDDLAGVLEAKIKAVRDEVEKPIVLQPGSSTVQVFTMKTSKGMFFRPSSYRLHIEIEYTVDNAVHRDAVDYSLSVSTSLRSLMYASGLGSAIGYVARDIFGERTILAILSSPSRGAVAPYLILLVGNVILGVIAAVLFARKKDVQPLIAIEDFWGGLLVGFFVGYLGQDFFGKFLPSDATTASGITTPAPA